LLIGADIRRFKGLADPVPHAKFGSSVNHIELSAIQYAVAHPRFTADPAPRPTRSGHLQRPDRSQADALLQGLR